MSFIDENRLVLKRADMARTRTQLAQDRTRLANKRTFLAWCRTALSFMTFGFLLEKIDIFLKSQQPTVSEVVLSELGMLGQVAFVAGPLLILFAGYRFYALEKKLGVRKPGRSVVPEIIVMIVTVGAAIGYVFS